MEGAVVGQIARRGAVRAEELIPAASSRRRREKAGGWGIALCNPLNGFQVPGSFVKRKTVEGEEQERNEMGNNSMGFRLLS